MLTATESIVKDLSTLGVPDQNNLSVGALSHVGVDDRDDRVGTLGSRLGIAETAAGGLATASRVVDRLCCGAWVCRASKGISAVPPLYGLSWRLQDVVHDCAGGTVASWGSRLTSAEDVDVWALVKMRISCCSDDEDTVPLLTLARCSIAAAAARAGRARRYEDTMVRYRYIRKLVERK